MGCFGQSIATCTVDVISALPQQGRKNVHNYKLKLRAYCPKIHTVFLQAWTPHTSIYLVWTHEKKK